MEEVRFLVEGRVQRVGFRRFCLRQAQRLMLSGWVRNNADGNVEAYVKGQKTAVIDFINACRQGPLFASVVNIQFLPITQEIASMALPDTFIVLRDN